MMLASPMCVLFSGNPAYDHYSMKLASIDGFDGKMAAFNLTLLVGSRRWFVKNCFSHGQVTVSYAGVPMGEGRVRGGGFCAEPRSEEAEVSAVARGGKAGTVPLPDNLRRRMEAELRWGAAEFDVEARLFRNGGDTRAPSCSCARLDCCTRRRGLRNVRPSLISFSRYRNNKFHKTSRVRAPVM